MQIMSASIPKGFSPSTDNNDKIHNGFVYLLGEVEEVFAAYSTVGSITFSIVAEVHRKITRE